MGQPGVSPGVYMMRQAGSPPAPTAKMAVLQQIYLRVIRHGLGKPDADAD